MLQFSDDDENESSGISPEASNFLEEKKNDISVTNQVSTDNSELTKKRRSFIPGEEAIQQNAVTVIKAKEVSENSESHEKDDSETVENVRDSENSGDDQSGDDNDSKKVEESKEAGMISKGTVSPIIPSAPNSSSRLFNFSKVYMIKMI